MEQECQSLHQPNNKQRSADQLNIQKEKIMPNASTSSGTNTVTTKLTPEEQAQISAQTGNLLGTVLPTWMQGIQGATNLYNTSAPGVTQAGQNLAGTAQQVQQTAGETGESALRTGITGLESLFNPQYEQQQVTAALQPAQAQYMQNLANQGAQYGGAGELGSARQALASQQLAGTNRMNQATLAANIGQQIAGQRATVAGQLGQLGQAGLTQALGAAGQNVNAANVSADYLAKLFALYGQLPSYVANPAQIGQTVTTSQSQDQAGFKV